MGRVEWACFTLHTDRERSYALSSIVSIIHQDQRGNPEMQISQNNKVCCQNAVYL